MFTSKKIILLLIVVVFCSLLLFFYPTIYNFISSQNSKYQSDTTEKELIESLKDSVFTFHFTSYKCHGVYKFKFNDVVKKLSYTCQLISDDGYYFDSKDLGHINVDLLDNDGFVLSSIFLSDAIRIMSSTGELVSFSYRGDHKIPITLFSKIKSVAVSNTLSLKEKKKTDVGNVPRSNYPYNDKPTNPVKNREEVKKIKSGMSYYEMVNVAGIPDDALMVRLSDTEDGFDDKMYLYGSTWVLFKKGVVAKLRRD